MSMTVKEFKIPAGDTKVVPMMENFISVKLKELAFRYENDDKARGVSLEFWKKVDDCTRGNIEIKMMKILEETNEFLASCFQLVTKHVLIKIDGPFDKKYSLMNYNFGEPVIFDARGIENLKSEFIDMLNASVQYAIAAQNSVINNKDSTLVDIISSMPHEVIMKSFMAQYKNVMETFNMVDHSHIICPIKFFAFIVHILDCELGNNDIFKRCKDIIEKKSKEINV